VKIGCWKILFETGDYSSTRKKNLRKRGQAFDACNADPGADIAPLVYGVVVQAILQGITKLTYSIRG
jgi:hypothetical protein